MSSPLTRKSADHSDLKKFAFSFFCDRCGREWKSLVMPFESGGFTLIENEDARRLIWEQEHKAAFEQANLEAHLYFNRCKKCEKNVCDDCFDIEGQHEEICKECS